MDRFAILETEDGYTIVELPAGQDADELAASRGAVVADPGPFSTYEDAQDALDELQVDDDRG